MRKLRRRQGKKKEGEPDEPEDLDEIKRLLDQAKDLIGNQSLYDLRQKENDKQLKDLLDKIVARKKKLAEKDKLDTDPGDENDLEKLL